MSHDVELHLALILFLPWFAILGGLYWLFPRRPRTPARRLYDAGALLAAGALSVAGMRWGFLHADPQAGAIWKQVLATLAAYGAFLGGVAPATVLRALLFRPPPPDSPPCRRN